MKQGTPNWCSVTTWRDRGGGGRGEGVRDKGHMYTHGQPHWCMAKIITILLSKLSSSVLNKNIEKKKIKDVWACPSAPGSAAEGIRGWTQVMKQKGSRGLFYSPALGWAWDTGEGQSVKKEALFSQRNVLAADKFPPGREIVVPSPGCKHSRASVGWLLWLSAGTPLAAGEVLFS